MDLKHEGNLTHHCWLKDGEGHMPRNMDSFGELKVIPADIQQGNGDLRPTAARNCI